MGSDLQRPVDRSLSTDQSLGEEFSPAGAGCRYRAPLTPRLARPFFPRVLSCRRIRPSLRGVPPGRRGPANPMPPWLATACRGRRHADRLPPPSIPLPAPKASRTRAFSRRQPSERRARARMTKFTRLRRVRSADPPSPEAMAGRNDESMTKFTRLWRARNPNAKSRQGGTARGKYRSHLDFAPNPGLDN